MRRDRARDPWLTANRPGIYWSMLVAKATDFELIDSIDQQALGRIRVCST